MVVQGGVRHAVQLLSSLQAEGWQCSTEHADTRPVSKDAPVRWVGGMVLETGKLFDWYGRIGESEEGKTGEGETASEAQHSTLHECRLVAEAEEAKKKETKPKPEGRV